MSKETIIIPERRLHPMTLAYQALRSLPAFLIPVYFAVSQGNTEEWFYIIISIAILIFTVPMIILQYYYFTFYLTDREIVIRSGVFSRKQRNVSLSRVQNVNIEHNVIQRLFGLTKVELETAGDVNTEAKLEFMSKSDAENLRQTIRKYQSKLESNKTAESEYQGVSFSEKLFDFKAEEFKYSITRPDYAHPAVSEPVNAREGKDEKLLFTMGLKDAIKLGMLRFRPLIFAIVLWVFGTLSQFRMIDFENGDYIEQIESFLVSADFYGMPVLILSGILIFILATWIIDIVLTINQYYDFKLLTDGKKLYTNYGLLTKRHATIPLKKLQSIMISTNPFKKMFNFYKMDIQTAGLGTGTGNAESVIPFAKEEELKKLASNVRDFNIPEHYNPVSKKTIRRTFIRYMIMITGLSLILFYTFDFGFWLLTAAPLIFYYSFLRWKYMGWKIDGDNIIIQRGVWKQRQTVIPIEKIQTLNIERTFFQRWLGLSTMNIDMAASPFMADSNIVDVIEEDAEEIMNQLSQKFHNLLLKNRINLKTV